MDNATQLDLLKLRIPYNENIFDGKTLYYGWLNGTNYVYTLSKTPIIGDMTYLYVDEEMVENTVIDSVSDTDITIDALDYLPAISIITIYDYTIYESVLNRLLEDSKYIALSIRFPYQDYSTMTLPIKYNNWQLRCCEELYKLIGSAGIKSYSENGLSWTRDSGYISTGLVNEIEPVAGYIIPTVDSEV